MHHSNWSIGHHVPQCSAAQITEGRYYSHVEVRQLAGRFMY